ncbi:Ala-tRNA(Pro) hydrolase [Peptoclostridium litorale DSM 5388]|uniref:Alanyl-tRNA editing protein AlaX-M n=1 Tax=Peptoclostridium litorale DSM 5388 TaxID=1121324 RepID=A0A069RGD9_PEPLI|nr:alanyl-tRNA editing protein [Peptoclostridium litorale]KDR96076.1 alanyl-tRNA editing protein AlaX-M [Peptoclostridium litorale DSM 5388]SIO05235.1 Ala-tRNA(Pro) hydrolase [Peptoclostridium litorale DSM 5388]
MTKLLYQTDSYVRSFKSRVAKVLEDEKAVVFEESAFYPGGGGQPHDTGTMKTSSIECIVLKVKKAGGEILHYLDSVEGVNEGDEVLGQIDWERRYSLMRTHTAMHILCAVVWRDYGAQVTGGNMEPLSARMDFEFENLTKDIVGEIEQKVNEEIKSARRINVSILEREEAFKIPDLIRTKINLLPEGITHVRTVEIEGLDIQADGGTHVMTTDEVGSMKIVDYKSKGKINKRIYVQVQG